MNESDNIALFDMDGTLANYDQAMYDDMVAIRSEHEPPLEFERLHDLPEPWETRRKLIVQRPGWWRNLQPLPVGMWLFERAIALGFKNNILTKGPKHCPNAWKEKVEWCHEELFKSTLTMRRLWQREKWSLDIHIVSDKAIVYGKMLVDDYPPYVEAWLKHRPRGLVFMPAHKYNEDFTHPNVIRCGPWEPEGFMGWIDKDHHVFQPEASDFPMLWQMKADKAMRVCLARKASEPLDLSTCL